MLKNNVRQTSVCRDLTEEVFTETSDKLKYVGHQRHLKLIVILKKRPERSSTKPGDSLATALVPIGQESGVAA